MYLNVFKNGAVLKDAFNIELPDLTVLTGENGSGKTQLLRALLKKEPSILQGEKRIPIYIKPNGVAEYEVYPLLDENSEVIQNIIYASAGMKFYESINYNHYNDLSNHDNNILLNGWKALKALPLAYHQISHLVFSSIEDELNKVNDEIRQIYLSITGGPLSNIVEGVDKAQILEFKEIIKNSGKEPRDINELDYLIFRPISGSSFTPRLQLIFYQFEMKLKHHNKLFKDVTPPWDLFNEICETVNFKFRITYFSSNDDSKLGHIKLVHRDNPSVYGDFANLSSGENTILSLIFALYGSINGDHLAQVLLLDEPDAHLHPSYVQRFLDVLYKVLVKKHSIKIILTTHSATTVALARPESIFLMDNDLGYPRKVEREEAISSLTVGLNGLFVSHENRRQVFVESEGDEKFYEQIYILLKEDLRDDIHLSFISSGTTKLDKVGDDIATCDRVIEVTNLMREYGNQHIWGIVDWDLVDRSAEPYVVQNGFLSRYSMENLLLDPLLIGILLIRHNLVTIKITDIGNVSLKHLSELTQAQCQEIAEVILSKLAPNTKLSNATDTTVVEYRNEYKLILPNWFLHHLAHPLEDLFLNSIDKLKSIKKRPDDLKLAVIKDVLETYPEFIPMEFFNTFDKIMNG